MLKLALLKNSYFKSVNKLLQIYGIDGYTYDSVNASTKYQQSIKYL